MKPNNTKIILGIDPGTISLGYAIIEVKNDIIKTVEINLIDLKKIANINEKLKKIYDTLVNVINKYNVDLLAIESPFYGKNVQSMLKLGKAQGIAIACSLASNIDFVEYSPKKIKQSVTGNGNASKEQVARILLNMGYIKEIPKKLDATDSLAVAICHALQKNIIPEPLSQQKTKSVKSWKSFITNNPDRIK